MGVIIYVNQFSFNGQWIRFFDQMISIKMNFKLKRERERNKQVSTFETYLWKIIEADIKPKDKVRALFRP